MLESFRSLSPLAQANLCSYVALSIILATARPSLETAEEARKYHNAYGKSILPLQERANSSNGNADDLHDSDPSKKLEELLTQGLEQNESYLEMHGTEETGGDRWHRPGRSARLQALFKKRAKSLDEAERLDKEISKLASDGASGAPSHGGVT